MSTDSTTAHEGKPLVVYTIGHSNGSADGFVGLLRQSSITLVVDVRSAPYSQYTPQFSRERLVQTLREARIGYTFAGESLGGRPTDPTCYFDGHVPIGRANYLKLVDYDTVRTRDWYCKGIMRLRDLTAQHTTALMCSEEDPAQCHRHHLIAQTLLNDGITVWHIRGTGARELAAVETKDRASEQQLSLFDLEA